MTQQDLRKLKGFVYHREQSKNEQYGELELPMNGDNVSTQWLQRLQWLIIKAYQTSDRQHLPTRGK